MFVNSDPFRRVNAGGTVRIVAVHTGSLRLGGLHLIGRLCVEPVIDSAEARQILGTGDIWPAAYQAIALAGTEEPLRELSLDPVAPLLRFESPTGRDRLDISDGYVSALQLQTMRRRRRRRRRRTLTPESARLLGSVWTGHLKRGWT